MLVLKFLEHVQLLLLITRRLPSFLLSLIVHHLLHHAPRLTIQIAQLTVLGVDLGGVDLGGRGDDVRPPFHLVDFVEVDGELLAGRGGLERPGGFVDEDGMREGALDNAMVCQVWSRDGYLLESEMYLNDGRLALDGGLYAGLCNLDIEVPALQVGWNGGGEVDIRNRLRPCVGQLALLFLLPLLGFLVELLALSGRGRCRSVVRHLLQLTSVFFPDD